MSVPFELVVFLGFCPGFMVDCYLIYPGFLTGIEHPGSNTEIQKARYAIRTNIQQGVTEIFSEFT